jgi:hypothetical protein
MNINNKTQMANIRRCTNCILSENFPGIKFDEQGVCNFCTDELFHMTSPDIMEKARSRIAELLEEKKGRSAYDAILCYSGGKDSTYLMKLAIEKYKLKVFSFTLDNGFISPAAFRNIERIVSRLGVDHVIYRPSYLFMKELFRVSTTENIYNPRTMARISSGCNSCITIINTTALRYALEKEAPFILTGFNLGQIPANTIYFENNYEFFRESRKPVLDKLKSLLGPDVEKYMEIPDNLLRKSDFYPYNINLLTLEDISEHEIIEQIKPLGWIEPEDVDGCSTNCIINCFNKFVHQQRYGYSPYELELSYLIRKSLLTRDEAIRKCEDQPAKQIEYVSKELGFDVSHLTMSLPGL